VIGLDVPQIGVPVGVVPVVAASVYLAVAPTFVVVGGVGEP
jgi:hypothetical protein